MCSSDPRSSSRFICSSRRVEIAGVGRQANGLWMSQVARNLSDAAEGFLIGKRYLIHDRDPLFTIEFLQTLESSGVQSVKLPPRSPNLNAVHGDLLIWATIRAFSFLDKWCMAKLSHSRGSFQPEVPINANGTVQPSGYESV